MEETPNGAPNITLANTQKQRLAAARAIRVRVSTLGRPVAGEEHDWHDRIAQDYSDVLTALGLVGFWVLEDRNDKWIDGLSVGCPDGERIEIPELAADEMVTTFASRVVDFFARLTAHRVAPVAVKATKRAARAA